MESETPEPKKRAKTVPAVIGIFAIVAILAIGGWLVWSAPPATTPSQSNSPETTSEASKDNTASSSEEATITFTDSGFSPSTLTVKPGTRVTVVNSSSRSVQFSSDDHPTHTEDPEINMDVLAPGERGSFTVKTVGTHGFHDHLDDSKVGTLVVTE